MAIDKTLIWKLGVASISLLAAVLVYVFARSHPPELLTPLHSADDDLVRFTWFFGWAPSFFYTLAIGLLIGSAAPALRQARFHCLAWTGLALGLELSQSPGFAKSLSAWLSGLLSESLWDLVGPYWSRGVFDLLDLVATLVGGLAALTLLRKKFADN